MITSNWKTSTHVCKCDKCSITITSKTDRWELARIVKNAGWEWINREHQLCPAHASKTFLAKDKAPVKTKTVKKVVAKKAPVKKTVAKSVKAASNGKKKKVWTNKALAVKVPIAPTFIDKPAEDVHGE